MPESTLGNALRVSDVCGPLSDLHQKLAGQDGEEWLSALKKFLRKEDPWSSKPSDSVYSITVNYDQPLAEMIEAGRYDYVNPDITDQHFPTSQKGTAELAIQLIHFNKRMSSEDILAELNQRGLRPATLPELLAFGAQHKEVQRQFPVVALGSVWRFLIGRSVPWLWGGAGRRYLVLRWFELGWYPYYRFAAVCK